MNASSEIGTLLEEYSSILETYDQLNKSLRNDGRAMGQLAQALNRKPSEVFLQDHDQYLLLPNRNVVSIQPEKLEEDMRTFQEKVTRRREIEQRLRDMGRSNLIQGKKD